MLMINCKRDAAPFHLFDLTFRGNGRDFVDKGDLSKLDNGVRFRGI